MWIVMTTMLSLFAPPSTWKPAPVEKDHSKQMTETFGPVVKEFTTSDGGVVQVREYRCPDFESCDALATVPDTAAAFVDAYCLGKLTADKTKCADDATEYDSGTLGWARNSKTLPDGKMLHVFIENRAKDEKKGFAFSYVGPPSGVAEFVKITGALKPIANQKAK